MTNHKNQRQNAYKSGYDQGKFDLFMDIYRLVFPKFGEKILKKARKKCE